MKRALVAALVAVLAVLGFTVPASAAATSLPGTNGKVLSLVTYVSGSTTYAVVCGNFTTMGGVETKGIAVVNLNTNAVKYRGKVTGGWVDSCAVSNNTIWAAGTFTAVGGVARSKAAAFSLSDFSLKSWKPNVSGQRTYAVAAGADKVFLASSTAVRAVNMSTGATVWSKSTGGGAPRSLLVVPSQNRVYLGGGFQTVGGTSRPMLAALNIGSGAVDTTFQPSIRANTNSGEWPGFDGENVLALAYDPVYNRIVTGLAGHATNALAAFSASSSAREVMHTTVGDVQAVLVWAGSYYAGYHRSGTYPANTSSVEWIANAWTAEGENTTWGDGFSGVADKSQGGPYGNDNRNAGIVALAVNPLNGRVLAGGAFMIPNKSLGYPGFG